MNLMASVEVSLILRKFAYCFEGSREERKPASLL